MHPPCRVKEAAIENGTLPSEERGPKCGCEGATPSAIQCKDHQDAVPQQAQWPLRDPGLDMDFYALPDRRLRVPGDLTPERVEHEDFYAQEGVHATAGFAERNLAVQSVSVCGLPLQEALASIAGCSDGDFHVEGSDVANITALDTLIMTYMRANCIPNGSFAIVSADGRLVYCKSFTYCALLAAHGQEVFLSDVHSLFRVASVSKVITATAVLAAAEDGYLGSAGVEEYASKYVDFTRTLIGSDLYVPELLNIRISNLLTHSAGWVEDAASFPPFPGVACGANNPGYMFEKYDYQFASMLGICTPITKEVIQVMQNMTSLTWDPAAATNWSYSNHGFTLLARVLEGASRLRYEDYVRARVWGLLGAADSLIGDTQRSLRHSNEVEYFGNVFPDQRGGRHDDVMATACESSLVAGSRPREYTPYAYFNIRNSDGGAGWLCSIYDLALFLRGTFVGPSAVLSESTRAELLASRIPWGATAGQDQCFGWARWNLNPGDISKTGHFEGTQALAFCYDSSVQGIRTGVSLAYVFNRYTSSMSAAESAFQLDINSLLRSLASLGADDLFGTL